MNPEFPLQKAPLPPPFNLVVKILLNASAIAIAIASPAL